MTGLNQALVVSSGRQSRHKHLVASLGFYSFHHLQQDGGQLLLQLGADPDVAQLLDVQDEFMCLMEELLPNGMFYSRAPLRQPRSVLKDVTSNANGLQNKGGAENSVKVH